MRRGSRTEAGPKQPRPKQPGPPDGRSSHSRRSPPRLSILPHPSLLLVIASMLRFLELESCGQISGPLAASAKPGCLGQAPPPVRCPLGDLATKPPIETSPNFPKPTFRLRHHQQTYTKPLFRLVHSCLRLNHTWHSRSSFAPVAARDILATSAPPLETSSQPLVLRVIIPLVQKSPPLPTGAPDR